MPKIKTIRESLTYIRDIGGELSIKLAPVCEGWGEDTFAIQLRLNGKLFAVLLDKESLKDEDMFENCLSNFCVAVKRHLEKEQVMAGV